MMPIMAPASKAVNSYALITGMTSLMASLNLYAVYMPKEPFTSAMKIPTEILQDLRVIIDEDNRK